jgi:bla regulator protein blaR1
MNFALAFFGDVFTEAIGWFLIHSVWQGAIIAVILLISRVILKKRSAQLRYYISYAALILVVFSASFTFQKAYTYSREKAQLKETIISNPSYISDQFRDKQYAADIISPLKGNNSIRLDWIKLRSELQFYFPWIVSIWFIGLLFYFLRVSGSLFYLYRIRTFQRLPLESKWIRKVLEYCSLLRIKRKVGVYISVKITTPITFGFIKPFVLVPASLVTGLSPDMLEAIIVHELAHIRRNDYLMNILQTLIETLFFYHPGVWYISSQIRRERELACDDIALNITSDRINYAKALTIAQEHAYIPKDFALAFAPGKNKLLQRIKRLNTNITMKTNLFEKLTAGFLILSAFLFLSFIIDGNNADYKNEIFNNETSNDSLANPNIVLVKKTATDGNGKVKIEKRIYKTTEEEIDSLLALLDEHKEFNSEIEKVIEIVLTEPDPVVCEEIVQSIHSAVKEIDKEKISEETIKALKEAEKAAQEAMFECEKIIVFENQNERDSVNQVIQLRINEAMDKACREIKDIDIGCVTDDALKQANEALAQINIDQIVTEALEEAHEALEAEHVKVIRIQKELKDKELDLADQEVMLKEKEAELKQELNELEEQLKELKKKQKEESRKSE